MGPGQSPLRKLPSTMGVILRYAVVETNKKLPQTFSTNEEGLAADSLCLSYLRSKRKTSRLRDS